MDIYTSTFAALLLLNVISFLHSFRKRNQVPEQIPEKVELLHKEHTGRTVKDFKWRFLPVYLLVNGADWLQVCRLCSLIP